MTDSIAPEANTAANWWADLLADPDAGQTRDDLTPTVTADQVTIFRLALRAGVTAGLEHGPVTLDTEAGPSAILDAAMSAASIPGIYRQLLLPANTTMQIEPGQVVVARPAGAPIQTLEIAT